MPAKSPKVPTDIVSSPFSEQPNGHPTSSPLSSTSSLSTDSLKAAKTTLPSKTLPPPGPVHPNPCLSSSLTSVIQSSIPNTPAITACSGVASGPAVPPGGTKKFPKNKKMNKVETHIETLNISDRNFWSLLSIILFIR